VAAPKKMQERHAGGDFLFAGPACVTIDLAPKVPVWLPDVYFPNLVEHQA
jgi:hypothetical protein